MPAGNREMKTGKTILLITCLGFLLCIAAFGGAVFYYYTHPSSAKALVETSLSRAAGASVAIGSLSCSLSPLQITAKGITVEPGNDMHGVYLDVPDLYSELSLHGSFGRKSLIVKRLEAKDLSCRISQDTSLFDTAHGPQTLSFFRSILKRAFAFLVFRDLKIEGATLTNGAAVVQTNEQTLRVNGLQGRLTADHRIEISCGAAFEWPSREVHFLAPLIQMKTNSSISLANTQIEFSITLNDALFESPFADLKTLRGGARFTYRTSRGEVAFEDMNFTLQEADIKGGGWKDPVRLDLHVTADGAFSLNDYRLSARPLHITMGNRLQFSGQLEAAVGTRKQIDLRLVDCRVTPQDLVPLLPIELKKGTDPVKLDGPIQLTGRIGGIEEAIRWIWDLDLEARLNQNQISFTDEHIAVSGALTGSIKARGRVPDVELSTDLKAKSVLFRGNGIDAGPSETAISVTGKYPFLDLKGLSTRIPRLNAQFQNKAIRVNDIHLEVGKGRVNAATRSVSLPKIRFDSSLLKNITASLEAADGGLKRVEIQGKETGLAGFATSLDLLPSKWKLAARDAVHVQVRFDEEAGLAFTSEWAFQEMGFQDSDGAIAGENLSLKAAINAKTDPSQRVVTADIAVDADKGEALYDRFYVDLKKYPLSAHWMGTYTMERREFKFSKLTLELKDILACQLSGRIFEKSPVWRMDFTTDIRSIPLKPLFSLFVVEPFQAEKPILRSIQAEGMVSATMNLTGTSSAWTAKGSVQWNDGGISSEAGGIFLKGIDLSLPLWVQSYDGEGPLDSLKGRLSIGSVDVPLIPEQALTVPLDAGPNRLSVASPTVVKIPGGDVRIGPVLIKGATGSMPSVRTDLAMNRVQLGPLLIGVWPRPVEGTLTGALNSVRIEGGRLTSSGMLTARVFDGEIIFSDFSASGLLAGTPVFKVDARWKDLNLSKLTAETSFGKIEGVLNGHAKDLEIAHGQIQKFNLLVETVRKEGSPQRISVKAVDNIAQIGGGQSPFIGVAGVFASVFKEFPYEKIGVHATLENDVFRINGTIKEGDMEYLVKRGLLSGVNVVNQNPDNQVSFKDMIKRIKRIKTSKGGPVVK